MWILNKMMLGCDQASFLVSKQQETKLSLKEAIQLKMHLMACKMCRHFEDQSQFMQDNMKELACEQDGKQAKMDDVDKNNLKELLKNQMQKNN